MATTVRMPEVLTGVTEAAIQTWLVSEGHAVEVGTPLAEIETDKAVVEYAAEHAGIVLRILVREGEPVAIGDPIVIIGQDGEPVANGPVADAATTDATSDLADTRGEVSSAPPVPQARPDSAAPSGASYPAGGRLFASPLVRRLARARGVDPADVPGSGPNGRVVRRDLEAYLAAGAAQAAPAKDPAIPPTLMRSPSEPFASSQGQSAQEYEEIPVSGMRQAIARRLTESKSTVPHFYVEADCQVDALLELRRRINETSSMRISVNDLILKATAGALRDVPEMNSTWGDTVIRRHRSVDIAVAVAIDGGLVTPVLRDVDSLSLSQVSAGIADLVERARAGRLKQHELEGGAFTVSNLGMYGVSSFSAIINPPHAGILAISAARSTAIVDEDDIRVGTMMTATLSADHRVVDGALAAQWLQAFTRRIENPLTIVV